MNIDNADAIKVRRFMTLHLAFICIPISSGAWHVPVKAGCVTQ